MLDDPKSARVKGVSRLQQKDARFETGLFLLEGPQGLKELANSPELAEEVYATGDALDRYEQLFDVLAQAGVPIIECSERVIEKLAETKTPQGVVCVVSQVDVSLEELLAKKPKLIAILDQARDPGNAGTVLRAADAAGADGVIFTRESVDLYNSKLIRSTAGSIFHLPCVIDQDPQELVAALRSAGVQILASSAQGVDITSIKTSLNQPTAWVFGNEAHGVSQDLLQLADQVVALPIYGAAESLNLATAASVCLYASAFELHSNR